MPNKVRYGLKKAYYSKVTMTGNTPTFETPKPLSGAVSITLEPQGDSNTFYADDVAYEIFEANNGYEGTLELAIVPDEFLTDCLGMEMDNNDLLVEKSSDKASYFAMMFEFTGDKKAIRHCLYYCKAKRPTQSGETKGESVEPKTEELSFSAIPLPSSEIVKTKTTDATDNTIYEAWYTTVSLPDFAS